MAVVNAHTVCLIIIAFLASKSSTSGTDTGEDLHQLADATSSFALHLYRTLVVEAGRENVVFSPLSVSTALATTALGARGDTADQMREVLRLNNLEASRLHSAFAEFNSAVFRSSGKYTLKRANRLFGHAGFDLLPDFLADAQRYYASGPASLDFVRDAEGARRFINAWVGGQTENKIPDLLPPGSVDEMTKLVLVNAIYFKADWLSRFDKSKTAPQDFRVSADETIQVPMMRRKAKFNFAMDVSLGCKVLELPYMGNDLSMIVLLPDDDIGGINRLGEHLSIEKLRSLLGILSTVTVEVEMPRFKLEETVVMNEVLSSMGMTDVFVGHKADLSGISGARELFVSSVIHKAFLEVNEEGSEAAAATGVTISKRSLSLGPEFIVDHPFIFFIMDTETKAILFMGHCRRPVANLSNHQEL